MRDAVFCVTFVATLSAVAPAYAAENNLKGTYHLVGTQVCLVAPAGFKQDSKGNDTIPIGETNYSQLTTEGLVIYRDDGTGEAKQTFVTIVPPPNAYGTAVSAGTISYSFTYTREGAHGYRMAVTPGTFQGLLNAGPNAGQKFSIEGDSRLFRVSEDGSRLAAAIDKPFLQKISFEGWSQPVSRVCTAISHQSRISENLASN